MTDLQKEQTQECLEKMPMCNMKNSNGSRGLASLKDGVYKLVDTDTKQLQVYNFLEELLNAGWRID